MQSPTWSGAVCIIIFLVGLCLGQNDDEESGKYNCLRPGMDCANMDQGVTCQQERCVCVEGLQGYDCSINSTHVTDKENCDGGCGKDGICYAEGDDEDLICKCSEEYFGTNCENKRVLHKCYPDSMEVKVVPLSDDGFVGQMYVVGQEDDGECVLNAMGDGYYGNSFSFDACGGSENETLDNGDTIVSFTLKVQHNQLLIQDTDETYRFVCKVKTSGSDVEWEGEGLDHTEDDENAHKEVAEEFNPVVQELLTEDGDEVVGRQRLGTLLTLRFRLQAGNVYDSFRVEEVEAWNGREGPSKKTFPLVHDGCVTPESARHSKVVFGFTRAATGREVHLTYRVFRLPGSFKLQFRNVVKACKASQDCDPIDCQAPFLRGFGRKRRSVDHGQILYERLNQTVFVVHPGEVEQAKFNSYYIAKEEVKNDDDDHRDTMLECMSSVGFLVICIVLAILLLLALAIIAVFCVRMLHRHDDESRDHNGGTVNKGYKA